MEVRAEKPEDVEGVRRVNIAAFGRESEANLVDQLRGITSTFSFVAVEFEQIERSRIVESRTVNLTHIPCQKECGRSIAAKSSREHPSC